MLFSEPLEVHPCKDFLVSQAKYYYKPSNKDGTTVDEQMSSLKINLLGINSNYGYEYIKPTSRLVLTPLTLKCFRTLILSSKLGYFNALHGPGGVGKTETVKDYCRLMGRMCIVLNCSEAVTSNLTGRLLKGVAASRVWVLFDDFNRMSMNIVSVVAQQLGIIRRAGMSGKQSTEFDFEGDNTITEQEQEFITDNALGVWHVRDEDELLEKISNETGWLVSSCRYVPNQPHPLTSYM